MTKIFINPSHQPGNKCKMGDTEEQHCKLIANEMAKEMTKEGNDLNLVFAKSDTLNKSIEESNKIGPDLHVDVHTNAFNGTPLGPLVLYYSTSAKGKKLAQCILGRLNKLANSPGSIRASASLAAVRRTKAPAVIVEAWAHDNKQEAEFIHDNIAKIAKAINDGIRDYLGVKKPADCANCEKLKKELDEYKNIFTKIHKLINDLEG